MLVVSKQKYTALVLSLFIHLFILIILFFLILSQYHGSSLGNKLGKELTDTLFYEPITTASEKVSEPEIKEEAFAAAAEEALAATEDISPSLPVPTLTPTAPATERAVDSITEEYQSSDLMPAPSLDRAASALHTAETELIKALPALKAHPKKIYRRKKRPGFSFAKLGAGLKKYTNQQNNSSAATHHEWLDESLKEKLKDGVYIDNKGIPHRASDVKKDPRYAHVDDELAKMAFFSYMKGVNSGLKNAFSLTKETVYFNEKSEERYSLELTIIADGSVSEVRILQHFEKREFDEYVIRTIKNYQFAPLPKRLKTPHIIKRLDAIVHARAGTNRFELVINY